MRGALRVLSSGDTLAPRNEETVARLRALHPSMPPDRRAPPTASVAALHATQLDIKAAITSFPQGSAGGPDGLRPQHLKDLLADKSENDPLLLAITDFINVVLAGKTPEAVRPIIFGGALTALQKNSGVFDQSRWVTPGDVWQGRSHAEGYRSAQHPYWPRDNWCLPCPEEQKQQYMQHGATY